jgi:hypothetical protein
VVDEETLFVSTQMRQIGLVRSVLKSGVCPTLKAFQYAAENEFFELCRLFVEFGSREILSNKKLERKLIKNFSVDHLADFKIFINRGIDFTAFDNYCICSASEKGYFDIVSLFLEHGVDSSGKDKAVQIASDRGHADIVRLLLDYGADPTTKDNMAIICASRSGHLEVVCLLLDYDSKYKVNPTAMNNRAIKLASDHSHLTIVELLEEYGASL